MKVILKTRFLVVAAIVCMAVSFSTAQELKPESKIITQPNSPITITGYLARYSDGYIGKRGIHHNLGYQNTSAKTIVAAQFSLVSFDIWNEYLDRTGGIVMSAVAPGAKNVGEWVSSTYADFSFHTAVAYVSKVRFDDGEIWTADIASIVLEMKKIEKNFDVNVLKKKDDGK